jgi:hypothetical protein
MKRAFIFPFFLVLNIFVLIPTLALEDVNLDIPTVKDDVTLYDEWQGTVNSSHPLYWGNYTYLLSSNLSGIFFLQKGGVHNHATYHTLWNENVYITKLTNVEYIEFNETEGQVLVHYNETHVFFSNGIDRWIEDFTCPLCGACMHGYEFSPWSTAIYWQCAHCRIIIGEVLQP